MHTPSRRIFLAQGAALVAASAMPASSPNATINVACLGTGGRCRHLMAALAKIEGVRIAAVCDVWDKHLDDARKLADPKAIVSRDYKELLARKDVDAVLIGAPDHWHVPMTIDAVAAGKDVYVEKPLTHDLAEGKKILDAVRQVQTNRCRSAPSSGACHTSRRPANWCGTSAWARW